MVPKGLYIGGTTIIVLWYRKLLAQIVNLIISLNGVKGKLKTEG